MVQRKRSFLTFAKENQSPLGLYRNPLTFFFSNPRFVLLIRDWCFVLLSPLRFHIHHFSLVRKLHIRPLLSARKVLSREHVYDSKQKLQITVYSVVNIYIFLAKMLWFTTGGLCSPHWAVWGTFLLWWMRFIGLLFDCRTRTPTHCHYKAWKSQDIFLI